MKERNYKKLNSTLLHVQKMRFSSVYFAIACFSATLYELGRHKNIALIYGIVLLSEGENCLREMLQE